MTNLSVVRNQPYRLCVLDTETTGLEPDSQFVELASATFNSDFSPNNADLGDITYFDSLAKPSIPIPPMAKAVHHITEWDVQEAYPPATVLRQHEESVGEVDYYVAHNAPYDRGILGYVDGKYLDPAKWLDTCQIARHLWPDAESFGNQYLRYYLGLEVTPPSHLFPHRALYDVFVTGAILLEQLKLRTVPQLQKLSVEPALMKICHMKKHKGMLWKNVPKDYLNWVVKQTDMDMNIRHTAMYYLNNQGSLL